MNSSFAITDEYGIQKILDVFFGWNSRSFFAFIMIANKYSQCWRHWFCLDNWSWWWLLFLLVLMVDQHCSSKHQSKRSQREGRWWAVSCHWMVDVHCVCSFSFRSHGWLEHCPWQHRSRISQKEERWRAASCHWMNDVRCSCSFFFFWESNEDGYWKFKSKKRLTSKNPRCSVRNLNQFGYHHTKERIDVFS